MNQFFSQLAALLKDRQEVRLNITKIKDDLVILAVPNFKEEGKAVNISGSPAELDENFITEFSKPMNAINSFSSNAAEVAEEIKEDMEDDAKSSTKKKVSKSVKKPVFKKEKAAKVVKPVKKSAKELKEEKNRLQFDKLIGASRAFISEKKFKDAVKNLKAALKLLPKNEDAIKLLEEATAALKAPKVKQPKVKPVKVEKNPEINFDQVNTTMKDQAAELTSATQNPGTESGEKLKEGELPETILKAESISHENLIGSDLETLKLELDKKYDELWEAGRIAFDNKEYLNAADKYGEASTLKGIDDIQMRNAAKIASQALEALEKENESKKAAAKTNTDLAKYNAAMIQGKEEMVNKKYAEAVACFEDAVAIYPHYQEATDSLAKAKQLLDAFNLLNS